MKQVILGAAMFALASSTMASVLVETVDAGITAETALRLPNGTETIFGSTSANDIFDIYSFSWGGGLFRADTVGSEFDTMLSLFNPAGVNIAFNDDAIAQFSLISRDIPKGDYFLGIMEYPNAYMQSMQDIQFLDSFGIFFGNGGNYQINTNIVSNAIPEPGLLALLGIGLFAIMINRRYFI